ncbi:GNAT family N-acetyltransferase [Streptomyces sp. 7-21]|uniref:GNAT family N-acetyltransferase n=1 Tax=Streptomyces sp. 7-21 TaxID=2802283 RepID=UPI00191D0231|nr:GNAT family N-acetyltransferase [Streptomyces sp. 7-21]MBL1066493.1 GNAT family N-acetyltransferase [Streptomyces sp. 7-21]
MSDVIIRGYRPSDRAALDDICIRTGHVGGDARGHFREPELLPLLFAAPYAAFDPDLVFVADNGERAIGYIVGTDDSPAYYERFRREWLPPLADRYPAPDGEPDGPDATLRYLLHHPETMMDPEVVRAYPAHLHIDLLPEGQRQGFGRRLMTALWDALRARGVPGVHLGLNPANTNARAFYDRLGFTELTPSVPDEDVVYLGKRLG